MEKKIAVPVSIDKDSSLGELELEVQVEVEARFFSQKVTARPARPSPISSTSGRPIRRARRSKIDQVLDELLPRSKRK